MNIVVVGAGEMGGAIATRAARTHAVAVRGSKLGSDSAASVIGDSHGKITEASDSDIAAADLVVVAVPWSAFDDTLSLLRDAGSERVVSVVVPWTGNDEAPAVGRDDSVAERFARGLPHASVAGAFTTVAAATIRGRIVRGAADGVCRLERCRHETIGKGARGIDGVRFARRGTALRRRWAFYGRRLLFRVVPAR